MSAGGRVRRWALVHVVAVGGAFWLVAAMWGPGVPKGLDTLAHLVRADFGVREVFGHGRLDGWAPGTGVGSEIFLVYGPGLALLVAALRLACFGLVTTAGAFKAVLFLSFMTLPLAVAYLARGFGLSRRAAGLAAVLSLAVSSIYGPGIEGTFNWGLVPVQVAAPFVMVALGALVRLWLAPRRSHVVTLAFSFTAVVLTHPISAVIFAALGATVVGLLVLERAVSELLAADERRRLPSQLALPGLEQFGLAPLPRRRDSAVLSLAAALGSALLAAFWLLPFLAHRDLHGGVSSWPTPGFAFRLAEILHGKILFRPHVAGFVVVGMVIALLIVPDHHGRWALVFTPLAYLFIAHQVEQHFPYNELVYHLPNRGIGYAGLVSVLPMAVVLDRGAALLDPWIRRAGTLTAVVAALAIALWPMAPLRTVTGEDVALPALAQAARELRRVVPESARFATERQPSEREATNVGSPPFWLALHSGRNAVNAFAPETMTAPEPMFIGDSMTTDPPEKAADRLARAGVTHVVTTSEKGADHFEGSGRFAAVWRSGLLTIFAVRPAPDRPEPASQVTTDGPAGAELTDYGNEHLAVRIDARAPLTATLAVAWSPKWAARVDGHPVEPTRAPDGLLATRLPAGSHEIRLEFRRDVWDGVGPAITGAALGGGALALAVRRRRRSRRARLSARPLDVRLDRGDPRLSPPSPPVRHRQPSRSTPL